MYRTIKCELWNDLAVRKLSIEAKLLFVYLITNRHTHVSGIYYLPRILIGHETGMAPAQVRRGIDTLSIRHLLLTDEKNEIVFVINMFGHQARGGKHDKGAATQLESLHKSPLINDFLDRYPQVREHLPDTLSIPHRTKDQDQDQDQDQDKKKNIVVSAKPSTTDLAFESFWKEARQIYSDLGMSIGSKAQAKAAWNKKPRLKQDNAVRVLLQSLELQATAKKAISRTGKDPIQFKHLVRWIRHECWDDDPDPLPKKHEPAPRIQELIPHDFGAKS
jgi:hypothetical protein